MKNLITSAACLLLLLAILFEFVGTQSLFVRILEAESAVQTFRELVREDGAVSSRAKKQLRQDLADCGIKQVEIDGSDRSADRGELVHYRIRMQLGRLWFAPAFWGREKGGAFTYVVDRYAVSAFSS